MNGVKQKFNDEETKVLFGDHDLLIIMETFFLKRHKTPDGFLLIGKSDPLCDARRGGVAVYKRRSLDIDFHVYTDLCPDMVVFGAKSLNSVFIAPYVAPDNSKYKIKEIFDIIRDLIKYFSNRKVFLMGDLNARCGDLELDHFYSKNPDPTSSYCELIWKEIDLYMLKQRHGDYQWTET